MHDYARVEDEEGAQFALEDSDEKVDIAAVSTEEEEEEATLLDNGDKSEAEVEGGGAAAAPQPKRRRRPRVVLLLAVGLVVALALTLGGAFVAIKVIHSGPADDGRVHSKDAAAFVLNGKTRAGEAPTTRYYDFVLEERLGALDGHEKSMLVVNGQYPGPTIEANVDDRIVVKVTNKMSNSTSIHWHGMIQRGTPYYDGTNAVTQCGIPPGESLTYNFTLHGWSGTSWWHAHYLTQYTDGISGPLIIHGAQESIPEYDGELVMYLADLYHRTSMDLTVQYLSRAGMTGEGLMGVRQGNEPVPDAGTINGVGQWGPGPHRYSNHTLLPNKTYRLRLINAGSLVPMRFSVDGHVLDVVEADGTPVEPYAVSGLTLDIGQRYSVLLRTNQSAGAYWVRSKIDEETLTYNQPGMNGNQLAVIRYGVAEDTMPDFDVAGEDPGAGPGTPLDLDAWGMTPAHAVLPPNATVRHKVTVSSQNTPQNNWLSFISHVSWEPINDNPPLFSGLANTSVGPNIFFDSQYIITVPEVEVVDIIINNYDDGPHPFHLHGHKFFVMDWGHGMYQNEPLPNPNPMRRDTVTIHPYSWTVLRFVADNPGYWAFHCHNGWHSRSGLLMQFATLPSRLQEDAYRIPEEMVEQCKRA